MYVLAQDYLELYQTDFELVELSEHNCGYMKVTLKIFYLLNIILPLYLGDFNLFYNYRTLSWYGINIDFKLI